LAEKFHPTVGSHDVSGSLDEWIFPVTDKRAVFSWLAILTRRCAFSYTRGRATHAVAGGRYAYFKMNEACMNPYVAEFLGTALLVLLGNGVVANVVLQRTKGEQGGWIVITAGWGVAVFVGVTCSQEYSGAHLNPAVTLGLAMANKFQWALLPGYMAAQFLGAALGALLVYMVYQPHYVATEDADAKLGTFCTAPAIRQSGSNFLAEVLGTFTLVLTVLLFATPRLVIDSQTTAEIFGLGALGALPVGLLVFSIGLSLGGTTGYAINPARDISPRAMHWLLPVPGKRDSDWSYAWVPLFGPLVGAALAAGLYRLLLSPTP
jgi:glycerol uptake facilitator protein